ncbi:MAG: GNAT family N-acetyltransferase [Candidatus Cyclobacteriaceae bacterium M3_2C_046]
MIKELNQEPEHKLVLRNLKISDYDDMVEVMTATYPDIEEHWSYKQIKKLIKIFPEGQICIDDKEKVIAFVLSIIVDYNKHGDDHTYEQILDNYEFNTHDPDGDVLYGIEVIVHPEYRNMRLGRRLYDARKDVCEKLNLKSIVAGGRMPNYFKYSYKLDPEEYIEKVQSKEIYDPVMSFQISNDFLVKKVLTNYMPGDNESRSYATLLEWNNIYYSKKKKIVQEQKSIIRLGLVQWQMRNVNSLDSLFENAEFFVDAISSYKADFLLFPELFMVPLMAEFNELGTAQAIRRLAGYSEDIKNKFVEFALSYNVNIIAGSMPVYEDDKLYNVACLCRRDGTIDYQYKIHITPSEYTDWGMSGGDKIAVFDTDSGKIGISICYDVEFPEVSRIMAREGLQILFVPFATDTQNGYQRVRYCAQARAIENECYVAISGSVGNLPKVRNMDIQYAQSAVLSPCDFAFPNNGIVAEATPNTEMTLIADVDLDLLKELHIQGSVRNLKDRRQDLYTLNVAGKRKVVNAMKV